MESLFYILEALCVLVLGFLPGYLLLRLVTRQDGWELLMNSAAFSILFAAFSEFAAYLLNINATWFNLATTLLLIFGCLALMRRRKIAIKVPRGLLLIFSLAFLAIVSAQALIPFYSGAYWYGDWWLHYGLSLFYLNHGPLDSTWFPQHYAVTSRTPIFNLAGAYFMSLFGSAFWNFQIPASFMNIAFLLPLALLAMRLGGNRKEAAYAALFLAVFSSALFTNAYYTWSKLLISLFLLAAIYYYLELRKQLLESRMKWQTGAFFGIYSAAAFLTHQTALFFLIPIGLDFLIVSAASLWKSRSKFPARGWGAIGIALLAGLLIVAPWFAWAFSTYGVDKTLHSSPASLSDVKWTYEFLHDRAVNGEATLLPLFQYNWYSLWFAHASPLELLKCKDINCYGAFYSVTLRFWLDTFPGALTLTGTIAAIIVLFGAIWKRGFSLLRIEGDEFLFLLLLPLSFILGTLSTTMYIDEKGWMPLFLPLLLIIQCFLARAATRWSLLPKALFFGGVLIEFLAVNGSHTYLLFTEQLTKYETYNLPLKADNHLVFAFDYLGGERLLFAFLAIASLAAILAITLREALRPYTGATASHPAPGRRLSRKARTPRRTAR